MDRSDEGMTPQHEQDIAQEERDAARAGRTASGEDPTRHPGPPGNPATDPQAVEQAEEQIGKVVGR